MSYFRREITVTQVVASDVSEPAVRSYFFGPGYSDLREFAAAAWAAGQATAQDYQARAVGAAPANYAYKNINSNTQALTSIFWYAAFAFCYMMNGSVIGIITCVHAVLLGMGTVWLFCMAIFIRLMDSAWRFVWRIRYPCPSCYHVNVLPVYLCPACGQKHRQLVPGVYGVFRRFCECGANLPVIHIFGRQALPCECSACMTPLLNIQASDLHIAFVGGPSSGKTNLFFMQLYEMGTSYQEAGYDKFQYAEEAQKRFCDEQIGKLLRGEPAAKTSQTTPRAIHLLVHPEKWPVDQSLYIYDVAGESFQSEDAVGEHAFYDHLDSVIFIVDPFSIPEVAQGYRQQLEGLETTVNACDLLPEEAYARMLTTLKSFCRRGEAGIRNARLAVIISKVDMFDLQEHLGRGQITHSLLSVAADRTEPTEKALLPAEQIDRACRTWLEQNGQGHLVRLMQSDFTHVRFFSASALGRPPNNDNSTRFQGIGVLDPLVWSVPRLRWGGREDGK
jgi:hypothetical protein